MLIAVVAMFFSGGHIYNAISVLSKKSNVFKPHFLKTALVRSSMTILLFMYMPLTQSILEYYDCVTMDDGSSRLERARHQECYKGDHMAYLPLAVISLIVFVIGIPALLAAILMKKVKETAVHLDVIEMFGNLYVKYRPALFWWELVVMTRKVLIVTLVVLLTTHGAILYVSILAVCVVYSSIALRVCPFVLNYLTYVDVTGLITIELVLMIGSQSSFSGEERTLTDISLIGMIVCTVAFGIFTIYKYRKADTAYTLVR